ncbi:MAG: DUF4157 domain-containing protein, partial [Gaiellaceae bacterium]
SAFLHGLAARQPADLALAPLTHDVALTAPAGIVSGVARPVVGGARPHGPLTLLRRLQRRVLGAAAAVGSGPPVLEEGPAAAGVTAPPHEEEPFAEVESGEHVDAAVAVEPDVLSVREPAAPPPPERAPAGRPDAQALAPTAPAQRATVAPRTAVVRGAPVRPPSRPVRPDPDAEPGGGRSAPRPLVPRVAPGETLPPLDAPPSPAIVGRAPGRATPVEAPPPEPAVTPSATRPVPPERRRHLRGLGPPLAERPAQTREGGVDDSPRPTRRPQQEPEPTRARDAAPPLRRPGARPPAPTPQAEADLVPEPRGAPAELAAAPGVSLPEAPTVRPRSQVSPGVSDLPDRQPAAQPSPPTPKHSTRPARVQPAPRPPAPLVSRRAMARVQRAAEEVPQAVRVEVERRLRTDLSGTRIHRGGESDEAARDLRARAFTLDTEIHVPSQHGPLHSGPARSLVAHELVHVAQQRRLGGSLPGEDSPAGRALEAEALTVEGGLTGAPAAAPPPTATFDTGGAPAPAGTATTTSARPATGRSPRSGPQRAPLPAHADEPGAQESVEELADRLYGHIRTRLRSELLVDRERAGLMTDVR